MHNNSVSQTQTLSPITIELQTQTETALEEVRVNMAELKAERKPVELVTSVESCIAICIHDSIKKCGGLAHIMLPDSSIAPREPLPAKFADSAVPALIKEIKNLGGDPKHPKEIGPAAKAFLDRQCRHHLKKEPGTLKKAI